MLSTVLKSFYRSIFFSFLFHIRFRSGYVRATVIYNSITFFFRRKKTTNIREHLLTFMFSFFLPAILLNKIFTLISDEKFYYLFIHFEMRI